MLALIGAVFLLLRAFDINPEQIDFAYLGLAFWAAHFGFVVNVPRGRTEAP